MTQTTAATTLSQQELADEVAQIIAADVRRTSIARDPVNRPMIHHLCDALEDRNPVYLNVESAQAVGHADVVAPPGALQVWNMAVPSQEVQASEVERAYGLLTEAGYPNVVAVNCEQTYERYLVPGDLLTAEERVESLVGPKTTGLGEGYFITTLTTLTDQDDQVVGTMRFRTLWYATDRTEDDHA